MRSDVGRTYGEALGTRDSGARFPSPTPGTSHGRVSGLTGHTLRESCQHVPGARAHESRAAEGPLQVLPWVRAPPPPLLQGLRARLSLV